MVFLIPLMQLMCSVRLFTIFSSQLYLSISSSRERGSRLITSSTLLYRFFRPDLQILNSRPISPQTIEQEKRHETRRENRRSDNEIGNRVFHRRTGVCEEGAAERCRLNEPFNTRESRERSSDPEILILSRSILDRRTSRLTELENNAPSGGRGMLRGGELFIANYPGLV